MNLIMGIKERIDAWLKPKDLSLILEIEETPRVAYQENLPGFQKGLSDINEAILKQSENFYFQHVEMLREKYGGRRLVIINGNETDDGKTRFYIEPAIRGKADNLTEEEFGTLFPKATHHGFYIERKKDLGRVYATA